MAQFVSADRICFFVCVFVFGCLCESEYDANAHPKGLGAQLFSTQIELAASVAPLDATNM